MAIEKQTGLLRDVLDSACQIQHYLAGVTKDEFLFSLEKQDAVLRRFEIIGEAASRLSPETQALFPHLPFRNMRGMRNIIAHNYGEVDVNQVWHTAEMDLNVLIETLQNHFANLGIASESDV